MRWTSRSRSSNVRPDYLRSRWDYLKKASEKVAVLKSANMSLGINLLMKLLKEAAVKLAGDGFDVEIVEKHHNQKLDAPSGTAFGVSRFY